MNEFLDRQKNKDITDESEIEIPGFMQKSPADSRTWKMRFQIFDLTHGADIETIEDLYTRATEKKNKKEGITIINEIGRFFDDGAYKMMVYWGEWENEDDGKEEL